MRKIAELWQRAYSADYRLRLWILRFRGIAVLAILLLLVVVSIYFIPTFQALLVGHYASVQSIDGLRDLILNIGSALIGAAAIVTSLVLFAMQVNIERMPHGLFRRLSADPKLLGAFALAFLLATGVATMSTLVNQSRLPQVLLAASWSVAFILILFLYAYRRALSLINPLNQLEILIHDTRRELSVWARRAQRAIPLLEPQELSGETLSPSDSTPDMARAIFFQINSRWTNGTKRAIRHAMSFARRYAEQGDYEVSNAALQAVVAINAEYVKTKGKTFYANSPFFDNAFAKDSLINDTLEHLRQNVLSGIARQDEQQIEEALRAMTALVGLYVCIDYSSPGAGKSHAQLAASYLANAVQAIVPHNMADVLMEGQRLLGQAAQNILAHGAPDDIAILSEKIALVACTGCVKEEYRPVTMEGINQLANLTFGLLRFKTHEVHFAVGEVRRDIASVVKLFLKVPETPFSSIHSSCLGPYYSSTSTQSFRARITTLVNATIDASHDNADAQSIILNIERWSEGIYETDKELLLAALQAKSHFSLDIITWITGVTKILLAVSNAPACDQHNREQLRKHAMWLIATLTWIPDDKDTIAFAENFRIAEILFGSAMDAQNEGCEEIAAEIQKYLRNWTFKAGKYETGWGTLEQGLRGLAIFAIHRGDDKILELKNAIAADLSGDAAPEKETRDHAAGKLLSASFRKNRLLSSRIDMAVTQVDHQKLCSLLSEIADLLSPTSVRGAPAS